jgi:hypothetical protein
MKRIRRVDERERCLKKLKRMSALRDGFEASRGKSWGITESQRIHSQEETKGGNGLRCARTEKTRINSHCGENTT